MNYVGILIFWTLSSSAFAESLCTDFFSGVGGHQVITQQKLGSATHLKNLEMLGLNTKLPPEKLKPSQVHELSKILEAARIGGTWIPDDPAIVGRLLDTAKIVERLSTKYRRTLKVFEMRAAQNKGGFFERLLRDTPKNETLRRWKTPVILGDRLESWESPLSNNQVMYRQVVGMPDQESAFNFLYGNGNKLGYHGNQTKRSPYEAELELLRYSKQRYPGREVFTIEVVTASGKNKKLNRHLVGENRKITVRMDALVNTIEHLANYERISEIRVIHTHPVHTGLFVEVINTDHGLFLSVEPFAPFLSPADLGFAQAIKSVYPNARVRMSATDLSEITYETIL